MTLTVGDCVFRASIALEIIATAPSLEARVLMADVLGCSHAMVHARSHDPIPQSVLLRYEAQVQQRLSGQPLAYVLGQQEFFSRVFAVDPRVLVPRADTECVVEALLQMGLWDTACCVLDWGTGSGNLAVTLACERPGWSVWGADRSAGALEVARGNALRHGATVHWVQADWYAEEHGVWRGPDGRGWDVVVSNPPYVASVDPSLQEPAEALYAQDAGYRDVLYVARRARHSLRAGGWLVLEHGAEQQMTVCWMLRAWGYHPWRCVRDSGGLPRGVLARWGEP